MCLQVRRILHRRRGDAHDLAADRGQLHRLRDRRLGVHRVARDHRLDANRIRAADADVADHHLTRNAAAIGEWIIAVACHRCACMGERHFEFFTAITSGTSMVSDHPLVNNYCILIGRQRHEFGMIHSHLPSVRRTISNGRKAPRNKFLDFVERHFVNISPTRLTQSCMSGDWWTRLVEPAPRPTAQASPSRTRAILSEKVSGRRFSQANLRYRRRLHRACSR